MTQDIPIIMDFEPQDNINGFLIRFHRQKENGRELTCPFKHDMRCENMIRDLTRTDNLCDNNYTLCSDYQRIKKIMEMPA